MRKLTFASLMLIFLLAACGRGATVVPSTPTVFVPARSATATVEALQVAAVPEQEPESDPENGAQLFQTMQPQAGFACATCHHPDQEARLIGPGLLGLGEQAATRVEGETAEDYLHNSIVNPNVHIVEGEPPYPENLMPQTYSEIFTEEQINDLVAYLLTL